MRRSHWTVALPLKMYPQALLPLRLWSLRFQLLLLRVCVFLFFGHTFLTCVLVPSENNLKEEIASAPSFDACVSTSGSSQ